jgi:hypothetical protein
MSRRHLDIIIATGGALFAVLALVLGVVAWNQADFAKANVVDQLSEQQIFFTDADKLTDHERALPNVERFAGQQVTTGEHAKAYASIIKLHMQESAERAGQPGATYATIGTTQTDLRAQIAAAKTANDPNAAELEKQLAALTSLRDTMFRGETLRGLLLTSYGFSVLGERAELAGTIAFAVAAVALALSVAGFIHAFTTPKEQMVLGGVPAPAPSQ